MASSAAAGYSGTPLAKKLGIRDGSRIVAIDAPKNYQSLLAPLPAGVQFATAVGSGVDVVHLFVTQKTELARQLKRLRKQLDAEASVWVSWPKQASKVPTSVTENGIRELALPLGFVDIKVCAVDATWSGLKLVVRKTQR